MGRVGEFKPKLLFCEKTDEILSSLPKEVSSWETQQALYKEALDWSLSVSSPCFLLPALIDLLYQAKKQTQISAISFRGFELYLNHFSGLDNQQEMEIRGKIAGRYFPQDAYQKLFPIGLKGSIPGPFVTFAHKSPDLDTITASFFGWLDAFAAKAGTGLHKWNIQTDQPIPQIAHLFQSWLGEGVFDILAISEDVLEIRAEDLIQFPKDPTFTDVSVDLHDPLSVIKGKISTALTVCSDGVPMGVISKASIEEDILGSVSLRDFCNADEGRWDQAFEVVHVLDHHRVDVQSSKPPCVLAGDVQSSNTLTYEVSASLNSLFGKGPFQKGALSIKEGDLKFSTPEEINRSITLLQALKNIDSAYFVSDERVFTEYLLLLYAIFDDTDLLAKMTSRDLLCVAGIVNGLKSLAEKDYTEVFSLDACQNAKDIKTFSKSLLQNEEMYSLYESVYSFKEEELERDLIAASKGEKNFFFSDTKEQKGCARIGQAKIFPRNVDKFLELKEAIQRAWLVQSQKACEKDASLKVHNLMISTLESASDLFEGKAADYKHLDELWFWIPEGKDAEEKLCTFFENFNGSPSVEKLKVCRFDFYGTEKAYAHWKGFVQKHLPCASIGEHIESDMNLAVLGIPAGSITSRKSQITPFLP